MSADNYYTIRPYAEGFVAIECCASVEDEPIDPINGSVVWPTVQDAYDWAKNQHSEYGVGIDDTCWLRTKQLITDHSDSEWEAQYAEYLDPSEPWRNTVTNLEHDVNLLTARVDNQTLAIEYLQDEIEWLHDTVALVGSARLRINRCNTRHCACDAGHYCAEHDPLQRDHPGG